MRAAGMRAGIAEHLSPKDYRKTISAIRRERKKGYLEHDDEKYANILYEVIQHDPVINRRVMTMKKRYPYLNEECYEMERHHLAVKKVEAELFKDWKPKKELAKDYENMAEGQGIRRRKIRRY